MRERGERNMTTGWMESTKRQFIYLFIFLFYLIFFLKILLLPFSMNFPSRLMLQRYGIVFKREHAPADKSIEFWDGFLSLSPFRRKRNFLVSQSVLNCAFMSFCNIEFHEDNQTQTRIVVYLITSNVVPRILVSFRRTIDDASTG